MRVVIVANPVSGRGRARKRSAALAAVLESRGHETVLVASEPRDATEWLPCHLAGADAVAAVGGDGTVRSVSKVLAEARIPIVHVPQGNENLFARSQGMGRQLADTVASIEDGERHFVDMAEANGQAMLLMASIGCFLTAMRGRFDLIGVWLGGRRRGKRAAYLLAQDWDRLLAMPLDAVRRELGLNPPPVYRPYDYPESAKAAARG